MNDVKRPYRNLRSNTGIYVKSAPSVSVINIDREKQINNTRGLERLERPERLERLERPDISHKLDVFERDRARGRVKVKRRMSLLQRILILVAIISLLIFLMLTFVFNSATVTITPRIETVNFNNESLTLINKDDQKVYDLVEIKKQASKSVPKSETKRVVSKAFGTITVYNNYNTDTQKLVKNTRFETPDGKVYRLTNSIVVPGKVGNVPGSIDTKVSADSVGDEYNIGPTKFTIPGFNGSPRFNAFYAQSTSNMTGGANGERAIVAQDDIDTANTILKTQLESEVQKEISAIYKDGYMIATGTISYEYTDNISDLISNKSDVYQISTNVKVLLIKTSELAKIIASKDISKYNNENVDLYMTDNINKFSINLAKDQKISLISPVLVVLQGSGDILFNSDVKQIQNSLAGKSGEQSNFNSILAPFSSIDSAVSKIFPYWINTFPKNPNKIEVVQVLPKKSN